MTKYLLFFCVLLFLGGNVQNYFGISHDSFDVVVVSFGFFFTLLNKHNLSRSQQNVIVFVVVFGILKLLIDSGAGTKAAVLPIWGTIFLFSAFPRCYQYEKIRILQLKKKMLRVLIIFFVVECGVALIERILGYTIFPWIGGVTLDIETMKTGFRSVSLHGHPLNNALMVSTMMSFLLLSPLKPVYKFSLWLMGFLAILCFNTRSSMIANTLLLGVYVLYSLFADKTMMWRNKNKVLVISVIVFLCGYFLFTNGYVGGRLLDMGIMDEHSSKARINVWNMLNHFDILAHPLGVSYGEMRRIAYVSGVLFIENFWIIWLIRFGYIFLVGYVIVYCVFLKDLNKNYTRFQFFFSFGTFILIASTNNSLASGMIAPFFYLICASLFDPSLFVQIVPQKYLAKNRIVTH